MHRGSKEIVTTQGVGSWILRPELIVGRRNNFVSLWFKMSFNAIDELEISSRRLHSESLFACYKDYLN